MWLTLGVPNWLDYPFGCKDVPFPEVSGSYVGGRSGDDCTRRHFHGEVDEAITQSIANARGRYQLSYEAPAPNGKYHKIRVECSRKDARILAPQGYYSETPQQQ